MLHTHVDPPGPPINDYDLIDRVVSQKRFLSILLRSAVNSRIKKILLLILLCCFFLQISEVSTGLDDFLRCYWVQTTYK